MYAFLCFIKGSGNNPNDGDLGPDTNQAQHGIGVVNYNGFNQNWNQQQQLLMQQQQQQQQYYFNNNNNNNNNNNGWQRPNGGNNYYNSPSNRYPPGSQGWYATGGNYWYNGGRSLKPHSWFILSIILAILFVCTY